MPNGRSRARTAPGAEPADAVTRILDATIAQLLAAGAGGLSMQEVADRAGVSKGLIHYHFASKDLLLARTVEWIGVGLGERLERALDGVAPASAIDGLWAALDAELARGHLRIVAELAHDPSPEVRAALDRVRRERRRLLGERIAEVFAMLDLTPRLPTTLIAEVVLAFELGLATGAAAGGAEPRALFDVFWLALLTITE